MNIAESKNKQYCHKSISISTENTFQSSISTGIDNTSCHSIVIGIDKGSHKYC